MIQVFESPEDLASAAADEFIEIATQYIQENGVFTVGLSGGSTPKRMYEILADEYLDALDWSRVKFFFGDERYVPAQDPNSNEGMARRTLLDKIPESQRNVFGMHLPGEGPLDAAIAYEALLERHLGRVRPSLNLLFLGLGADGHTLSLFPGELSVHRTDRLVIPAKAPVGVTDRISLTVPFALQSSVIRFLVAGQEKTAALAECLYGTYDLDVTPSQAFGQSDHPNLEIWTDIDLPE